jgi:hypothetical protein
MLMIGPTKVTHTPEFICSVKHLFGFMNLRTAAVKTKLPEKAQKRILIKREQRSERKIDQLV